MHELFFFLLLPHKLLSPVLYRLIYWQSLVTSDISCCFVFIVLLWSYSGRKLCITTFMKRSIITLMDFYYSVSFFLYLLLGQLSASVPFGRQLPIKCCLLHTLDMFWIWLDKERKQLKEYQVKYKVLGNHFMFRIQAGLSCVPFKCFSV